MTKIKNTKKGMAKKTLSMSLVVAMLATSNVPVWAAEFSDGSDAAVATEAPAVDAQATDVDTFTDDTDAAPVVDDTDAVDAQAIETSSENYAFTNVKARKEAIDTDWKTAFGENGASADELFDKDSAIIDSKYGNETQTDDLHYVFRIGGEWDETKARKQAITWKPNTNTKLINSEISLSDAELRAAAGKTLELLFLEEDKDGKLNVVNTISYGTLQKADLQSVLTVTGVDNITYDGTDKKTAAIPSVTGTGVFNGITYKSFDWDYKSTASDYVNAGSVITATGKLKDTVKESIKDAILGYKDTVSANCTIVKRNLSKDDVIVKLTTPKKNFEYQNNANTEVDKSEVKVYLKDFSKTDNKKYASAISLDEYVKKVTLDTTALGEQKLSVTFDADALKASKNFNETAPNGITSVDNAETNIKAGNDKVNVVALDLTTCEITLKNPAEADKNLTVDKIKPNLVIKKNGKELTLANGDVTVTLKKGEDYSQVGTIRNAITVAGNGTKVTGAKTVDLKINAQAFTTECKFENGNNWVAKTKAEAVGLANALDYNDGKAVEFAKDVLGKFSPDGKSYGDQTNFKITYDNNINATTDSSLAKLTVTATSGFYEGCSQDFYFKIAPSKVVLSTDKTKNTVATAVKKEVGGVALNESYTSADQYADAIGLAFTGTNGKDGDKKITSTPSANDYKVEYSFVKANHTKAGENEVGDQVKVVVTLKENGNFKADATSNGLDFENGIAGKVTADAKTNGVITLYVPIVQKSIDSLDVSLKEDTFTFTGEMINPEVVVKENGKTLKDVVIIKSITDGVNAGTATIKVSVNGYSGTKELKATINPAKLSDVVFEIKDKEDFTYNGKQQKPVIAQEDDPTTKDKDETITEAKATADVKLGKEIISKMFDITYGKNINAGEKAGSVTLTPKALYAKNFDGTSLTANFDILRAVLAGNGEASEVLNIKDATGKKVTIEKVPIEWNDQGVAIDWADCYGGVVGSDSLTWTGNEAKFASVTVNDKKLSITPANTKFDDDDYEVVYVNNTDATSGDNAKAYVAVIGKGNFKGEYSIVKYEGSRNYYEVMKTTDAEKAVKENPGRYTIVQSDVIKNAVVTYDIVGSEFGAKNITYSNGTYAGGLIVKPVVTVKDAKTGAALTEGTDYKVVVYDENATEAGSKTYSFAVAGLGKYRDSYVSMKDGKALTYSIDKKDLKDCYVNVDKKDGKLELTVMNGSIVEKKENFDVKDNGDGTATVSVVDGGKNYTGSVSVQISDAEAKVGTPLITNVIVKGNTVTPVLSGDVDGAVGYDYVLATEENTTDGRVDISKNILSTHTNFYYVPEGTYYVYCHAWKRDENNKKVFGEWSNIKEVKVDATTPSTPSIKSVKVKGHTVTVTFTASEDAKGYDVVLGEAVKKVNGENRPVEYGKLVVKNIEDGVYTATFYNVPDGKYYAGVHSYNKTSTDGKKVFSKWGYKKEATSVGKAK